MYVDGKFQIAMISEGSTPIYMLPQMMNRHGLITGATGTGKTVTLKTIAQSLSDAGVPTFLADVKGDVSGMAISGEGNDKLIEHLAGIGVTDYDFHACPVRFWDVYGDGGMPVRTTVSEMGPVLLGRLLGLTEVQEGVLNIVFHVADDEGLLLLDLKDLRSILVYVAENSDQYKLQYGNVSDASIGAIQRALLTLEDAGGDMFFGEPALDIEDWISCDSDGKGFVNLLDARRLVQSPLLYSTFLLWMLSELYETLPEVGDPEKPVMVFFFDEAHMLFNDAPKALLEKVDQVIKLIRSKGVGVFFITQNPADIPSSVLAQLSNRVQHALRAYTPAELKGVKAAAESFRENPDFDTETVINELATGEALVSFLDEKGVPTVVQRANVIAPSCSMDAAPDEDRAYIIAQSNLLAKYETTVDRVSAYEMLVQSATGEEITAEVTAAAEVAAAPTETVDAAPALTEEEIETYNKLATEIGEETLPQAAPVAVAPEAPASASLEEQLKAAEVARKEAEKEAERARKEAEKAAAKAERDAQKAAEKAEREAQKAAERAEREAQRQREKLEKEAQKAYEKQLKEEERRRMEEEKEAARRQRQIESIGVSVMRTAATTLTRTLMGSLKKR